MVKKLKDPNAPKRPMSGYFMWMASGVRDKLLAEMGGKDVAKIMKICGERWSKMAEEQKKVWQDKSKREKDAYAKKMVAYKKTDSFKEFEIKKRDTKVKGKKKPKDKNKPKRPLSGFFRFVRDFRKRNPQLKLTEVTKTAGQKWQVLDAAKKKAYMDAAASEQAKYKEDLARYKNSDEYEQHQEKLKLFKVNQKKKLKQKKLKKVKKNKA